ncbi:MULTISPECIES: SidA/IucD/PvdA family monooxygenase [unclassified Streptomyces]|nr:MULTISPECIES: SidA/IucD/PvdA family monooxygenase [unclassified Streptomyces]AEN09352.1 L-lysine 6-monooxygenase (NADPH) [Streptomyces sp. SirexAA-E]MYS01627.1 SidA/IucD/PvdA family monooxygenase [Streptomyces sp. SID4940]MYT64788.1 SidA/IucD/PvdA family monooxygenase [Streptomyces sp. SID8357]MYT87666.1 SidA/IucD/PvdA family monooxygenase [Streptomyces sp. SID8360]MYU35054.1 SidA/IucD/PvdA family monooxygenase [Streptomyces sp. SID8358]
MTDRTTPDGNRPHDLIGIGLGPFNLSLAALAHNIPGTPLTTAFYEQRPAFHWHPGLLIDGATLQVPFLADLTTLADPTSPWTFLNYLRTRDRLYPFYFAEQFHIHRAEYDAYCRWVSEQLPTTHFHHRIDTIRWNPDHAHFDVDYTRLHPDGETGTPGRTHTRNIALGVGTEPFIPEPLRPLADAPDTPVIHSADYLHHRDTLLGADHITVIGSGQSGAEIFLDLLRARPHGAEKIHWLARTQAFAPMEYSKLGLEHFTPDYTRYFHALPEHVRDALVPQQWQLHKGIDTDTIAAIHDELYRRTLHGGWPDTTLTPGVTVRTAGRRSDDSARIELHLEHIQQATRSRLTTDAVVLATGYRERPLDTLLTGIAPHLRRDSRGRPRIDTDFRLDLDPAITGNIYVQNAERHTHGVGAPDLGLAAWRSATILNNLTGTTPYRLPRRTAFTTFGLTPHPAPHIPGQHDPRTHAHHRPGHPAPHPPGTHV